jgi:uncharacterized protein YqeY
MDFSLNREQQRLSLLQKSKEKMSLKLSISEAIKVAMKAKETGKLSILRVVKGEIERAEQSPNGKIELADSDVIKIIKKMVDNIKETTNNVAELEVLEVYVPKQLSETEIKNILSLLSVKNVGEIMKYFKTNYDGLYDRKVVSSLAKELQ